ncbi:hypothetical protein [Paenibacillus harenae]|uniref:hypothetical protein n=1 Tax=Paenibacillus harenae TaxID=306543 RepID=UPI00278FE0DF|nr:hypothetical protein [Paenibacillus harenae]MDQ0063264.1 hypothetical protein [Paenibacillus harenae]
MDEKENRVKVMLNNSNENLIYIDKNDSLSWELNSLDDRGNMVLAECVRLKGVIESTVVRQYKFSASMLLGTVFTKVLIQKTNDIKSEFRYVEKSLKKINKKIVKTIAYDRNYEIYRTYKNGVGYWYRDIPDLHKPAASEFNTLLSLSNACLPRGQRKVIYSQLASTLAASFQRNDDEDVLNGFETIRTSIIARAESSIRISYFLSTLCLYLLLVAISCYLFSMDTLLFWIIGGLSGVTGAFVSTLNNVEKLSFDIYSPVRSIILQGCTRLLVGIISGLFVIIASKSNLILGAFAESPYSLAVFSFISGFSERFLPDLIKMISTTSTIKRGM